MIVTRSDRLERAAAAAGSVALQALLIYALLVGLSVRTVPGVDAVMKVFNLAPPPPPPPVRKRQPQHRISARRTGASSPRNIRSRATDIVVPPPVVPLYMPPPVAAAPKPDVGRNASSGASNLPGPGTGAGGRGNGSDDSGNGEGGSPPIQRSGKIRDSDYPRAAWEVRAEGTVSVRYRVETDGRATDCRVTGSSGNASLDETTCRLIQERFHFSPARDRSGHKVPSTIVQEHSWSLDAEPPPEQAVRQRPGSDRDPTSGRN